MSEENKFTWNSPWLVPVLSVLVIFQTLVLATLPKNTSSVTPNSRTNMPIPTVEINKGAAAKITFVPSGLVLKKGETTNVDLMLSPKSPLRIDGVETILTYDPKIIQVTKVTTPKLFSLVSEHKGEEKGRVRVTFFEEKKEGILLNTDVKLLTLTVKALAQGEGEISILTADQGATTVIAETATSRKVTFDKENLKIVVY